MADFEDCEGDILNNPHHTISIADLSKHLSVDDQIVESWENYYTQAMEAHGIVVLGECNFWKKKHAQPKDPPKYPNTPRSSAVHSHTR